MRFLAQTKGRREKERERKRKGKEEEGKEKGKGNIVFFKRFYSALFQRQLANKPRPWRITLLLELLYGGWTLIRQPILERFGKFKDIQFLALMHLLENNVPLTLSVYSVIFKSNAYEASTLR